ncbi:MAG: hypothetical protein Fur0014_17300 [Rubrivivax sp.]
MNRLGVAASDWPVLNALLDQALSLPLPERGPWLEALPAEHAAMKDTLARLLDIRDGIETGDFLGTLPKLGGAAGSAADGPNLDAPRAGDEVGPYRLIRELGEGGMGSVWLAERADGQLRRRVALKLPRLSWAAGLAERMARERDILARLEHPNIARLYDAGVDALGRPWLALEYVEGQPIDGYAHQHRLSIRQKLDLLLQVCSAVAFAHSRLVVHRDLKPGNILVTQDGQVRLLDFGIAKLMEGDATRETQLTQLAGRALTLGYASPEQIKGEPIGTASDVYSLGVVAYELLTGAKPYRLRRGSAAELEEAIATADPPKASDAAVEPQTKKALAGDLDAILNKALKKASADRYPTIDALAQDLTRHLNSEPVGAQPDAFAYRAAKFVQRYRVQTAAAATAVVALGAGTAIAWNQALRAERERSAAVRANEQALANQREAERQAEVARRERAGAEAAGQRAETMAVLAQAESVKARQAAAAERAAAETARREALRAEEVKRFVLSLFERADTEAGAGVKTTALELLQQARDRIDRELRDQPAVAFELKASLARSLGALGDYQGALSIVESLVGPQAPRVAVPRTMEIDARIMYAEWLPRVGRNADALARLRELEIATRDPVTPRAQRVATLRMLSVSLLEAGDAYREAVERAEQATRLADGAPDVPEIVQMRAWMALANARQIARLPGVLEPATRALRLAETLYPARTAEPVLEARQMVALGLSAEGRLREAIAEYRRLVGARIELLGPTHNSLAGLYNSMGNAQLQAGEPKEALATYEALVSVVDANDRGATLNRAVGRFRVASALAALRRYPQAVAALESALEMTDAIGGAQSVRSMLWRTGLAGYQARAGDLTAAEATLAKVDPARFADDFSRAEAALHFAIVRTLQGRDEDAMRLLADAERFFANQGNATMRSSALVGIAMTHFRAGRAGEHLQAIETAERTIAQQDGAESPDLADLRMALGRARFDRGDAEGGLASLREAERFWMRFDPAGSDAARVQGHLGLVLAARKDLAQAAQLVASARARLAHSARADDKRLLADLARAGL